MIVTLRNDFHNTEVDIRVPHLPYTLSKGQMARIWRVLCGQNDCTCGGVRGKQDVDIDWEFGRNGQACYRLSERSY